MTGLDSRYYVRKRRNRPSVGSFEILMKTFIWNAINVCTYVTSTSKYFIKHQYCLELLFIDMTVFSERRSLLLKHNIIRFTGIQNKRAILTNICISLRHIKLQIYFRLINFFMQSILKDDQAYTISITCVDIILYMYLLKKLYI